MRLLIKLPSRSRPEKLYKVLKLYVEYANNINSIQFLISLDFDDKTISDSLISKLYNDIPNCKICMGDSKSKIDACNRDISEVSNYDIILLASDDMVPTVKGYDDIIRSKMRQHFPDTDGVLWFNDGYRGSSLNTLSILGKKYYDRFGYIYYPNYKSFYCDNEFMEVANILKKQIYFNDVIIKHEHPDNTKEQYDELYLKNNSPVQEDKELFIKRKMNNFYVK